MIFKLFLCASFCAATSAAALDLPSNARLAKEVSNQKDSYAVPLAVFQGGGVPNVVIEGGVKRQVWQIPGAGLTPLQVLEPLRDQLLAQGYTATFECVSDECGGFDFRFGTDVLPAPEMHVNLREFQFATLLKGPTDAPTAAVTLLTSVTREAAYVQIVEANKDGAFATEVKPTSGPAVNLQPDQQQLEVVGGVESLLTNGRMVLQGLEFETGATRLGEGPFSVLQGLADFLQSNPTVRVALVGHTDSVGSLDGNIRISRQRAQSVRQRLIETYGISGSQMDAEGMGYLAPRTTNLTEIGRDTNRRVEVIVLSKQ